MQIRGLVIAAEREKKKKKKREKVRISMVYL
jgi:hypothetical protein